MEIALFVIQAILKRNKNVLSAWIIVKFVKMEINAKNVNTYIFMTKFNKIVLIIVKMGKFLFQKSVTVKIVLQDTTFLKIPA